MAVNITDENFYEYLEDGGEAIENRRQIPVMEEDEIDYTVSMPAVKYDKDPSVNSNAKPVEWRQVYWKTFWNKILEGYQMCVSASSELTDLIALCERAITEANEAATLANSKAGMAQTAADNAEASRVAIEANEQTRQTNEQNRVTAESQRQTNWTNFFSDTLATGCRKLWGDFWSNINTLWTGFWGTSADDPNGVRKQWSDIHATALENHEQAGQDHSRANQDHSTAGGDHATALEDHEQAEQDHSRANQDHSTAESDHRDSTQATTNAMEQTEILREWNTHQPYIGDGTNGDLNYWYIWNSENEVYVRSIYARGDNLDWESMTQAEKEALAREMLAQIAFDDVPVEGSLKAVKSGGLYTEFAKKQDKITVASVATCESIIDELM